MCGEHHPSPCGRASPPGSSPRVRGTRHRWPIPFGRRGIIPACAGNTACVWRGPRRPRDHPRVCGEHPEVDGLYLSHLGSSPRVRGTPLMEPVSAHVSGIIPACAGNTTRGPAASSPARDHPRVCGEHVEPGDDASPLKGSSPRVRGTLRQFRDPIDVRGIIPACAGNTQSLLKMLPAIRDHPRVCGEHVYYGFSVVLGVGSSPRVRGTPPACGLQSGEHGIIPACAGNTAAGSAGRSGVWDHPRVCGEHTMLKNLGLPLVGSSPRVRGTRR